MSYRILIVEDQTTGQAVQDRLTRSLPHVVEGVSTPEECLNKLSIKSYALILLHEASCDAQMLESIVAAAARMRVPVILTADGYDTPGRLQSLNYHDVERILRTPTFLDDLPLVVQQNLARFREKAVPLRLEPSPPKAREDEIVGLLARLAHQLNNPLTTILGCAELLAAGEETEAQRSIYCERIQEASFRCKQTLEGLAVISRPPLLSRESVRLEELLTNAASQLEAQGVRSHLELEEGLPPFLLDRLRIREALGHLLLNAREAFAEGAADKRVRLALKSVTNVSGELVIRIEVSDNGRGFDAAGAERATEPFFTTKDYGRAGLGLNLAEAIVQAHDGRVWLTSEDREWTRATIELPWCPAAHILTAAPVTEEPISIIVVDDEEPIRDLVQKVLSSHGYAVEAAANGEEALSQLRARPASVVVTDLKMPGVDGRQLYDRTVESGSRFVFMTGDTLGQDSAKFLERASGVTLAKPFTRDELLAAVRSVIHSLLAPDVSESAPAEAHRRSSAATH